MPNRMLPLYVQIVDHLRQQILNGELAPESRLSTQRELAEEFNTTLTTVRQALKVLEEENLIRTEHGIGSFVNSPSVEENNFNLLGFSNEMSQRALAIETRLHSIAFDVQNEDARRALLQPAEGRLVRLERLRLLNGKPLVFQRSYLPARLEGIMRAYQPDVSLYQQLHQAGGLVITAAKEILKPVVLQPEPARLLECRPNDPAMLSLRVSYHQDGAPVVFDEALLVADSFVVATERYGPRTSYQFHVLDSRSPDPLTLLIEND